MTLRHPTLTLAIGLTILLAVPSPGLADEPMYPGPLGTTSQRGDGQATAADLDGDGDINLVTADWRADEIDGPFGIVILFNDGDGTLAPWGAYFPGQRANDVAAADLDGDGDVDLATAHAESDLPGRLSVLLNNGDGTFAAPTTYGISGQNGSRIAAGDLDGDGDVDLVVRVTGADPSVADVFLNNGNGTFGPFTTYAWGAGEPLMADLNGDGRPDVAGAVPEAVRVMLNRGDGTFAPYVDYPCRSLPTNSPYLARGDVNNDGHEDLIAANNVATVACFLPGTGDGTFGTAVDIPVGHPAGDIEAGDLNEDGNLDLVVVNSDESGPSVLLGHGDGTFATSVVDHALYRIVATGDFDSDGDEELPDLNGDGHLDLNVSMPYIGSGVGVLFGNGDGTFLTAEHALEEYGVPVSCDLDGDGDADLAMAGGYWRLGNEVSIFWNDGTGVFTPGYTFVAGDAIHDITAVDVDDDGDLDLATADSGYNHNWDGTVSVLLNVGGGLFVSLLNDTGRASCSIAAGDFNNDTVPDLVVANREDDDLSILLGNGDGTFAPDTRVAAGDHPNSVAADDFNGDGNLDLVVANAGWAGSTDLSILLGIGDGTFAPPIIQAGGGHACVATDDLNGDGRPDLIALWRVDEGNNWQERIYVIVSLGVGDGTFHAPTTFVARPPQRLGIWEGIVTRDLNGDGTVDVATWQGVDSITVLLGNGDGTLRPPLHFLGGARVANLAADDVDGDGDVDLVLDNGFVLFNRTIGGSLPGDVDGDGDVDLADLAGFLGAYGTCTGDEGYDPDADFDDSGCVDLSDLATLLANYGTGA